MVLISAEKWVPTLERIWDNGISLLHKIQLCLWIPHVLLQSTTDYRFSRWGYKCSNCFWPCIINVCGTICYSYWSILEKCICALLLSNYVIQRGELSIQTVLVLLFHILSVHVSSSYVHTLCTYKYEKSMYS